MLRDNFAIIEGSMLLNGSNNAEFVQTISKIAYPISFNKDNCTLISFGGKYSKEKGYAYFQDAVQNSNSILNGTEGRSILLGNEIEIRGFNKTDTTRTLYFKIVLMKIQDEEKSHIKGDVNGDGVLDSKDVQAIKDYIMGNIAFTTRQFESADMNNDGKITSSDYSLLQSQINGNA